MNIRKVVAIATLISFSITCAIPADYNINPSASQALHPRSSFSKKVRKAFLKAVEHALSIGVALRSGGQRHGEESWRESPVTGAVALEKDRFGTREVASGWIAGERGEINGLSEKEKQSLIRNLMLQMDKFPGFDFSGVQIRVVEGASRMMELDGSTIVIDHRAFQCQPLLQLELCHEILEYIASHTPLGFTEPAVREAVILLFELDEFAGLELFQKIQALKALVQTPGLDQGHFSALLYASLPEEERSQIMRAFSAKELGISDVVSLTGLEARIYGVYAFLDREIYSQVIRHGRGKSPGAFLRKVKESLSQFAMKLEKMKEMTLRVALNKWTHEYFPNATQRDIGKWVRIREDLQKQDEDQNRTVFWRLVVPEGIGGSVIAILLNYAQRFNLEGAMHRAELLVLLVLLVAPGMAFLIIWEYWKKWKRWRFPAAVYDSEEKVIKVNPLRSKTAIEMDFKRALEDLIGVLEPAELERLRLLPTPIAKGRTSAFKTSSLGLLGHSGLTGWGIFVWGKYRYIGKKSPVLMEVVQYFMGRLGADLDIKTLKLRVLRSSDQLAFIDLSKRTIYVDERILHRRGLLHLEFAEELAHLFLHERGMLGSPSPGLEELAALMIKIEYFKRMDPMDQAEILLDLALHPEWDTGGFGKILAGVLGPKRRRAVQNAARLYHQAKIPPQMFTGVVEKQDLIAVLITYLLSTDQEGRPLYSDEVVESLKAVTIDKIGEIHFERLIERFEQSPSLLPPRPRAGALLREEILMDLDPAMNDSEREDVLVRAFINAVAQSQEDMPTIKDWIEAYLDFVYPAMETSPELDQAMADLRGRLRKLAADEDILGRWREWGYEARQPYKLTLSDQAEMEELVNLSFILQIQIQRMRNRFPEVADLVVAKILSFLKQLMLKGQSRRSQLSSEEKWLAEAFISVLLSTPSTHLYQVVRLAGERAMLLMQLSRYFSSMDIEEAQQLSESVLAIPLHQPSLVGKKMVWAGGFSPERDSRWLIPILTDADFLKTLGVDLGEVEMIRIQSLAEVLGDFSSTFEGSQKLNPFFLTLEGKKGLKEGVLIKVEEPVFMKRAIEGAMTDVVAGRLFWKMKGFQFFDITSFGDRLSLSKRDERRWHAFVAERMSDHVARLAAQLMDAQYYSGRLKRYGREAFEWFGKKTAEQDFYTQMLSVSPEQYEGVKSQILVQLRGHESQKFESFLNAGMTTEQLKIAVAEHLGAILTLFSLDTFASFKEMKDHAVLSPVWWAWRGYLLGTVRSETQEEPFNWEKHFYVAFQPYIEWMGSLSPERAAEMVEGLLNLVEEGMEVRLVAQFPDDGIVEGVEIEQNLRFGRALTLTPRKRLVDREGNIRSEVFLLHLGKIPKSVWSQLVPHLKEGAVRAMDLAGHLLKELGHEEESQTLLELAVDPSTLRLWRGFVSLYQTAVGADPYPRRNFQDIFSDWVRRLQLGTEELPVEGLLAEFLLYDALESLMSVKGYRLGRVLSRFKGVQFYEAQSEDGEALLIQMNVGDGAKRLRRTSIFQPPLLESKSMNLKLSPHETRLASFHIWRWPTMTELSEKVMHPIENLSEALDLLNVIHGLTQFLEENPRGYKHEGVVPLWVTEGGKVVIHPIVLEGKTEKRLNWSNELALPLRALLENVLMHLPEIIEAELTPFGLDPIHRAAIRVVGGKATEIGNLLKDPIFSPEAIASVIKGLLLFLREMQGYIERAQEERRLRIESLEGGSKFFERAA